MHQPSDGEVSQQQTIKLLTNQFWGLAAQDNPCSPQMGLQFIQGGFDLPSFVIKGRQFRGRGLFMIEHRSQETIDGFASWDILQSVLDDTDSHSMSIMPPILRGWANLAHIRTVGQTFLTGQLQVFPDSPKQLSLGEYTFYQITVATKFSSPKTSLQIL